jgi:hypothetical protein
MSIITIPDTDRQVDLSTIPLSSIANIIWVDWRKAKGGIYFGAEPYITAMMALENVNDMYGCDPGDMIVAYFLSNANTWRGSVARAVKAELRRRTA